MPYEVELEDGTFILVPNLEADGSNWNTYRANLLSAASVEGLATLYDGTETTPDPATTNDDTRRAWAQRNAKARCLIITTIPDSILFDIRTTKTAREAFVQVENLFQSSTTTMTTTTPRPPSRTNTAPRITYDKPRSHTRVSKNSRIREDHVPRNGTRREKKGGERVEKRRKDGREGEKARARA